MNFCRATSFVVLVLAIVMASHSAEALRGGIIRNLQETDPIYHFVPSNFKGCIQAQGKSMSSSAILAVDNTFCTSFTIDNNGLIQATGDSNLCLQAGHGNKLEDGSKMRLYPCNRSNELQKFAWTGTEGRLKLKSIRYDDLCVTFRGDNADYSDPIIFKKCHAIPSTHTQWQAVEISAETTFAL